MTEPTTALDDVLTGLPRDLLPEVRWSIEKDLVAWDVSHLETEVLELAEEVPGDDVDAAALAIGYLLRTRALLAARRAHLARLEANAELAEELRRLRGELAAVQEIAELERLLDDDEREDLERLLDDDEER